MNKQELENEEVRQEEKKTKKKKVRKKKTMFGHIRSIISILLVVGIIGGSYWYYAFQYRAEVEPETNRKVTNTDSVYTMEQYLKTLYILNSHQHKSDFPNNCIGSDQHYLTP